VAGDRGLGEDLKGSGRRLIEIQSRHMCVETKESFEKLSLIMRWPGKIRSGYLPRMVLGCCSCSSLFSVVTIKQQTSTVVIRQTCSGDVRFKPRLCASVKGVFMLLLQVNTRVI
jgi:hypothetical protein